MIRIHTLGGLTVRGEEGKPVAGSAAQPRRMAVLALLARAGERGITREKVLALLWPDADDERGSRALAQACYALRKDLGSEDAITGTKELRINSALVSSDVGEFATAVSRGDDERAAALYEGPFLDGFRLPGADEFSRWLETERTTLAHDYARILESLARAAQVRNEPQAAVTWWRKLAAIEPLNARVAVGLMEAMSAAGDRAGALLHAHIYEVLLQEELDLPPDREVMALAERLRKESGPPPQTPTLANPEMRQPAAALAPQPVTLAIAPAPSVVAVTGSTEAAPPARILTQRRVNEKLLAGALAAVVVTTLVVSVVRNRGWQSSKAAEPAGAVVAIGRIASHGGDSSTIALTSSVTDLLATSLARVPNLRLVSPSRMLELMHNADTSATAQVNAAREAGATDVIDGVLYSRPGGLLRLDLRRVDLASGAIRDVRTVEGRDLFALVDSGTAEIGKRLGGTAPQGSIADVTTRSVTAYRMYTEGMRAYYHGDSRAALNLFDSALNEDSTFALAAYYGAVTATALGDERWSQRLDRARRLVQHAPERERLIITASWAYRSSSPSLRAIADTLSTRYPAELQGDLYNGVARVMDGDFDGAIPLLEHVATVDSLALRNAVANCAACEAMPWLVAAYQLADSSAGAERAVRRWFRLQRSWPAAQSLISVIQQQGRVAEAEALLKTTAPSDATYEQIRGWRLSARLRSNDFAAADELLREDLRRANSRNEAEGFWWLAISLREQGRLAAALDTARQLRRFPDTGRAPGPAQSSSVLEAQILLEAGQARRAAAVFDTVAHLFLTVATLPSERSRQLAFTLTHAADAYAAAGDTTRVAHLVDSVFAAGQQSGFGRDRRLYHHVRGLLFRTRGRDAEAIAEFQAAVYSLTVGYTRTNLELARLYLRNHRERDAIAVLQPALRGALDASNLYANRTELHELLAQAWDAAGARDSAVVHYNVVAKAWSSGDAPFRARADAARNRVTALTAMR